MWVSYKERRKQDREERSKFRGFIEKTHDTVIKNQIKLNQLEKENEKVNSRLNDNDKLHDTIVERVCVRIDGHTCTLSLTTEKIVKTLVLRTDIQNGHLADLKEQGDETAKVQTALLLIAQGRKSLWKELAIVIATTAAVVGISVGVWQIWN
jgi:hypothetical protein